MQGFSLRMAALLVCLAGVALAAPAESATVAKLRVGQHPGFTRVVFELDAAAGYRLERSTTADGRPIVIVTLAAGLDPGTPRKVRSASSLLESVTIEQPQDRAVATLHLRRGELPIKEMILRGPPRIVLDVVGEDTALARVTRRAKPAPAPVKPEPRVAETPEPAVAKAPAPTPKPTPAPTPKPKLEPTPTPVARAQPKPSPEKPAARPTPPPPAPAPRAEPKPEAGEADAAERAAKEAMDRRLAAVREAAEQRKRQLEEERRKREAERAAEQAAEQARKQAEARAEAPAAAPAAPEPPGGYGGLLVGGLVGLLAVGVIVAVVMARRRALPKDLDVHALEDGPEEPAGGLEFDEAAEAGGFEAAGREPLVAGAPSPEPPLSAPGLFDESEKGETSMDTHGQNLMEPSSRPVSAPAAPSADVSSALSEFERRLSSLEARLQESEAARERLERQVAAQSEELRVQRAAIARTQRALRGLSRSEEEQATEPALRD